MAEARPYLRYIGVLDARIRPEHRAWHGIDPGWAHNMGLRDQGIESRTMI